MVGMVRSSSGDNETWSAAGEVQRQDLLMDGRQERRGEERGRSSVIHCRGLSSTLKKKTLLLWTISNLHING